MPDVYRCPLDRADSTATSYFTFVSPKQERGRRPAAAFEENVGLSFRDFTDGTSNILLAVEINQPGTPWTKPGDLPFREDLPLPKLGGWYRGGFNLAMCDGSVRFVTDQIDEETLRRLIMRNDGNPVQLPP
jgi:prepilin-type processing-associated H-X9-DG protein